MLETIKRAAIEAQGAGQPLSLCYGKVTKTSPLKIMVDNKMELGEGFLIVPSYLTDYKTEIKIEDGTKQKATIYSALKKNDSVMLLRMQGGQSFLVLCRV